jgi:hypothetical protein
VSETNEEYRSLLTEAYRGEVLGEALFDAFAAGESDPGRIEKLRVLQRIEGDTAARLRPLATAAGIEVDGREDETVRSQGREIGRAGIAWDGFVKSLHDALPAFLAGFVRLRAIADDPADPALVALITHEQAINAFTELELAGHPDRSMAVLEWYLEGART